MKQRNRITLGLAFATLLTICLSNLAEGDGFAPTGSLTEARYDHTATLLPNGKVLVAGGHAYSFDSSGNIQDDALASAELYDPATGNWSFTGSLGGARYDHTATLLPNGKVLVVGGKFTAGGYIVPVSSAELYNPANGTWTTTGSPANGGNPAILLPNGKVLVVGYNSAELYNPATGTWSSTGSPTILGGGGSTATLLLNGKVLVAGGGTNRAELYDPISGTWALTGTAGTARSFHTATLLSNGNVLVAGGFLNSAELYVSSLNPLVNPVKLGDGSFKFNFSNPSGPSYHVLASPDLTAPLHTWSDLGPATETPAGSGLFQFTETQAPNFPQRFYRVSSP